MRHNHPHGPVTRSTATSTTSAGTTPIPPVMKAAPGDVLEFDCLDPSCGQITPDWKAADLARLDFGQDQPDPRPDRDRRRRAGRCLAHHLPRLREQRLGLDREHPGLRPAGRPVQGAGAAYLEIRSEHGQPAMFGGLAAVPLKPFCGTIGVAPAEPGLHSVVPPRRVGGNMDIRDLSIGTELFLPDRGQGRPVLHRRSARRAGRRRSLRHRHRKPAQGHAEARSGEGRQSEDAALPHARARSRATWTRRATT